MWGQAILEYASCVRSPRLLQDNWAVESVQRHFTKRLTGMQQLSYVQRLESLGLESLEARRLRSDLVMTFKVIFNLVDVDASQFFVNRRSEKSTRGHQYRIEVPIFKSECRRGFFSERVITAWNNLPSDTNFTSLNGFKQALTADYLRQFSVIGLN